MQNSPEGQPQRREQFSSSPEEERDAPVQSKQFSSEPLEDAPETKERSVGALISIVIIVGLLIVGALYFWGKWIDTQAQQEATLQNLYNQENVEVVE